MHVIGESSPAGLCRAGERPHHDIVAVSAGLDELPTQGPVATTNQIARGGVTDRSRDDDPEPERLAGNEPS